MNRTRRFQDHRPPHEIQAQLERDTASLFHPVAGAEPPAFAAAFRNGETAYRLRLRLDAATAEQVYWYSLDMESAGPGAEALSGWADFWTRDFKTAPPSGEAPAGSPELLGAATAAWLAADSQLTSIAAIQHRILEEMKRGATYATANKEGSTTIRYQHGRFVVSSDGEWTAVQTFSTPKAFFAYLWKFFDWRTSQYTWPARIPEFDAWKLILRFLEPPPAHTPFPALCAGLARVLEWLRGRTGGFDACLL